MKFFKKLAVISTAFSLCIAGVCHAQDAPAPTTSGIHLNKSLDFNTETGTGLLTLETFVEGEVKTHTETTVAPMDVIFVLDVSGSMDGTFQQSGSTTKKIDGLKAAVNNFIDALYQSDVKEGSSHRVAIVKYGCSSWYGADGETGILEGNHQGAEGGSGYNYTEVRKRFTVVDDAGKTALHSAVNSLVAGGATASDYGLEKALNLLRLDRPSDSENMPLIILFTDGDPSKAAETISSQGNLDNGPANFAIKWAYDIKHDYGATIYTVGVFYNLKDQAATYKYMNYVSSNYPEASGFNSYTPPRGYVNPDKYFKTADSPEALNDIFQTISEEITEGDVVTEFTESSVIKDFIAPDFRLPAGTIATDITVYANSCTSVTGTDDDKVFTFSETRENSGARVTVDSSVSPQLVKVTGFDFSENWCGTKTVEGVSSIHGKRLVIQVPIVLVTEVPGGIMPTNGIDSGLYVDDDAEDPAARYPVPEIVFMVIKKFGLSHGESAIFNIYNSDDELVNRVVLTGGDSPNVAAYKLLIGMDPGTYTIVEEPWAWAYTAVEQTLTQEYPAYPVFDFHNNPILTVPDHAESIVVNDFKAHTATTTNSKP